MKDERNPKSEVRNPKKEADGLDFRLLGQATCYGLLPSFVDRAG